MIDHIRQPKAPRASRQGETGKPRVAKFVSAPARAATHKAVASPAKEAIETRTLDLAAEPGMGERVAKALARAGVASRREVERYIADGRVALNGRVLDTPAVKVEPRDVLTVDGKVVAAAQATRVWRYHKPVGLVTSHKDPQGRPTVFDALPAGLPRVISIGRLDLSSEGLLLLTNDGALARALELPSSGWIRRYRARAYGRTTQAELDRLKDGITVDGIAYGAIDARLDKVQRKVGDTEASSANCWITVQLKEGKNREVRRVLEALGLKVNRLVRLSYGPFALATLPAGALEEIGPRVIREQLEGLVAPQDMPTGSRAPPPAAAPAPKRRAAAVPMGDGGVRPEKKVYKPGWAKPTPKARHAPSAAKRKAVSEVDRAGSIAPPRRKAFAPPADAVMHAYPAASKPARGGEPGSTGTRPAGAKKGYVPRRDGAPAAPGRSPRKPR